MRGIAYPVEQVGLKLNASKTKVLTTQAQPRSTLTTAAGGDWKFWNPQILINGVVAFNQPPTRAIDNKI